MAHLSDLLDGGGDIRVTHLLYWSGVSVADVADLLDWGSVSVTDVLDGRGGSIRDSLLDDGSGISVTDVSGLGAVAIAGGSRVRLGSSTVATV